MLGKSTLKTIRMNRLKIRLQEYEFCRTILLNNDEVWKAFLINWTSNRNLVGGVLASSGSIFTGSCKKETKRVARAEEEGCRPRCRGSRRWPCVQLEFISFLPSSYLKPLLPSKCVCFYANWFDFFSVFVNNIWSFSHYSQFPIWIICMKKSRQQPKPDKDDKPCSEFGECILEWMTDEEEPRNRVKFNSF